MRISDWSSDVCSSDLDFEQSPSRVELDLVAKFAQVVGEFVAIDLSRSHLLGEHGAGFEARHLLVAGMPSPVEDHDVGMEMRVEFARGMFSEARIEQLACRFLPNLAVQKIERASGRERVGNTVMFLVE